MRVHDKEGRGAVRAAYDPLPLLARIFIRLRLAILPLEEVESEVPSGRILDVGCGYGLLSHYLALTDSRRRVTGIEYDPVLVARARQTVLPGERLDFAGGDARAMPLPPCDAVVLCDLLHHLPARGQEHILREAAAALVPGGQIVVKDIEAESTFWYFWNLFHDRVLRLSGPTHHRTARAWADFLSSCGLSVSVVRHFRHLLYHHIIVVASRPTP